MRLVRSGKSTHLRCMSRSHPIRRSFTITKLEAYVGVYKIWSERL